MDGQRGLRWVRREQLRVDSVQHERYAEGVFGRQRFVGERALVSAGQQRHSEDRILRTWRFRSLRPLGRHRRRRPDGIQPDQKRRHRKSGKSRIPRSSGTSRFAGTPRIPRRSRFAGTPRSSGRSGRPGFSRTSGTSRTSRRAGSSGAPGTSGRPRKSGRPRIPRTSGTPRISGRSGIAGTSGTPRISRTSGTPRLSG